MAALAVAVVEQIPQQLEAPETHLQFRHHKEAMAALDRLITPETSPHLAAVAGARLLSAEQLDKLPEVGVPSSGVVNVGLVDNTTLPVPVEVVTPVPPLATGSVPVTPVDKLTDPSVCLSDP